MRNWLTDTAFLPITHSATVEIQNWIIAKIWPTRNGVLTAAGLTVNPLLKIKPAQRFNGKY